MTRRVCVMGHHIAYSRSPMLHGYWLRTLNIDGAYELKDLSEAQFADFFTHLRANGYVGGNVTKPHKEAAFQLVDRRDAAAEMIGAVNTVWYEADQLIGGNTDWIGFVLSLDEMHPGWDQIVRNVVILGAGGAARAVIYGCRARGLRIAIANRTLPRAQELASHFGDASAHKWSEIADLLPQADLLINTSSLGMAGQPPLEIDLSPLKPGAIVYDIVYVPLETRLLRSAREAGHPTIDGLSMLLYQAVPAFARWFGVTPKVTPDLRLLIEADIRATSPGA